MRIRFFLGVNDREVKPQRSEKDVSAHYAWCLQELLLGLTNSKDEYARKAVLQQFADNMNLCPGTKKMLQEVRGLFEGLLQSEKLPDNAYILNCLQGMPVGQDKSYISYSIDR